MNAAAGPAVERGQGRAYDSMGSERSERGGCSSPNPPQKVIQRGLERARRQGARQCRQRPERRSIYRICKRFSGGTAVGANLHAHADSSKFPTFTLQSSQKLGAALPHDAATAPASAARSSCPLRSSATRMRGARGRGRCRRTTAGQRFFAARGATPRRPAWRRSRGCAERLGGTQPWRKRRRVPVAGADRPDGERLGGTRLNIILVSSATARPGASRWIGATGRWAASGSWSSSSRSPASSISSLCGTRRRSSTRGCRRSCSPTSGRKP